MHVQYEKNGSQLPQIGATSISRQGNVTEIIEYLKKPMPPKITKLSNDLYMDEFGEVHEFQHSDNRSQNLCGVRKTLKELRSIINANCTDPENCIFWTLTYRENMQDHKRLYSDFDAYKKRLQRYFASKGIVRPEYIAVSEPQNRGAWHLHILFLWPQKRPRIEFLEVIPLWPYGSTRVEYVRNCDNMGAYFCAYLADLPLEDLQSVPDQERSEMQNCEIVEKEIPDPLDQEKTIKKKFVKGARLFWYPPGMNLYRTSRGIVRPEKYWSPALTEKEKASYGQLTYSCALALVGDDGKITNSLCKSYYNSKRQKKQ